ncbi:MAG: TonB family protein [bacterium]|nr:TonB family protein [bacterium]
MYTARIFLSSLAILALAASSAAVPPEGDQLPVVGKDYQEHVAKGRRLLKERQYDQAIAELEKAESLAPGQSLAALSVLARAYRETDRTAEAIEAHRRFLAAATDPELTAKASNMLGVILLRRTSVEPGDLRESEQAFRKALELRPREACRARLNLAEVLYRAGDEDAALGVLEKYPHSEPADSWRRLATVPVSDHIYDQLTELLLARDPETPVYFQGSVSKPQKISAPQPFYTRLAAKNRIEGRVILRTVIDRRGHVARVEVLKGLPLGLTEVAVEAVEQWRFNPATFRGRPVALYYNLTINFRLPPEAGQS